MEWFFGGNIRNSILILFFLFLVFRRDPPEPPYHIINLGHGTEYWKSDTIVRNGYWYWLMSGIYFNDKKGGCTYIYIMNKVIIQIRFVHGVLGGGRVDSVGLLWILRIGIWILFSICNGCNNLCGGWSMWYKPF